MAVHVKPVESELAPLPEIVPLYLEQNIRDIQENMRTQCVFPAEVYSGYRKVNEYRRKHGMWYSTGKGAESFSGHVYQADEKGRRITVGIQFNDYLRYVDIGVGLTGSPHDPAAHITADKVQRERNVNWRKRYIRNKWNRRAGNSHRPAVMRTIRRLRKRYENYLADFYGERGAMVVINSLAGLTDDALFT